MRRIILWGLITILGTPLCLLADEQTEPQSNGGTAAKQKDADKVVPSNTVQPDPPIVTAITSEATIAQTPVEAKDSKYWIGLTFAPVDDTLRTQLGLDAGSGLVIRQIAEKSPAIDAGVAVHDIVTHVIAGDQKHRVASNNQMSSLVQQVGATPMTFLLLRRGMPLSVTITPKDRKGTSYPSNFLIAAPPLAPLPPDGPSTMAFRMVGPVVPLGNPPPVNLPDDVTVIITKSGSQPVSVKIQQKDRGSWGLKEGEPAAQPEHVSHAVISTLSSLARLSGRLSQQNGQPVFTLEPVTQISYGRLAAPGMMMRPGPMVDGPGPGMVPPMMTTTTAPTLVSIQKRLDEFQKQQEQMTKALDELRQAVQKSQTAN